MRVISINVNGIRAAKRKGLLEWLSAQQADFICLQETKAQLAELGVASFELPGYTLHFSDAVKKGYSGVAIYTRKVPDRMIHRLGWPCADDEGRYIALDVGSLTVVSLYLPSGSSGDARQSLKFEFMEKYQSVLAAYVSSGRDVVVCGDWNIVHKAIDIKNFKANQKSSGCLPEERAWMNDVFDQLGFADAFRQVNTESDQYTWWSNRGRAWENNVGWRIDYQVVTPGLGEKVRNADIYKAERFSDHAPLLIDYDYELA